MSRARAAMVVVFGLSPAAMLACNGIIGLDDPTVRDGGGVPGEDVIAIDVAQPAIDGAQPAVDAGCTLACAEDARASDASAGHNSSDGDATLAPDDGFAPPSEGGGGPGGPGGTVPIFVHAAGLPSLFLCFGYGTRADGTDAQVLTWLPFPWGAPTAMMPGTGAVGPLTNVPLGMVVTVFALDASQTPVNARCPTLIGNDGKGGLMAGKGVYRFAPIAAGTFGPPTLLVALIGCPPGTNAGVDGGCPGGSCGPDYDAASGNLRAVVGSVDTVVNAGTMGGQAAHASPALVNAFSSCADVRLVEVDVKSTPPNEITPQATYGSVSPGAEHMTLGMQMMGQLTVTATDGVQTFNRTDPLDVIASDTLNGPMSLPDGAPYFTDGENYVFVVLGDPSLPRGSDAGLWFRTLGFAAHLEAGAPSP